jgi:glutaconate CoA-transferase subunit B
MIVTSIHPGVTRAQIEANTGWRVRYANEVAETPVPRNDELAALRELHARTKRAHGEQA